jgi:integrase
LRGDVKKPSGIAAKEAIGRVHLVPRLGKKRLDAIRTEDVQRLKQLLHDRAAKTVNNVLTVLNVLLKMAVTWDVIERMPCTIRLLPVPISAASFLDFEEYEQLVTAAAGERDASLTVLLGGEAGLRCGEMMALEWTDVNFTKHQLCIQRSDWHGHVTAPKGARLRYVPMTTRLASALRERRHLRGKLVLCKSDGAALTQRFLDGHVRRASRRAGLRSIGSHALRHTFCSHLAMRGAAARAIQELAGHRSLNTTLRYMHLSPAAIEGAIRLLEPAQTLQTFGDILEMATADLSN